MWFENGPKMMQKIKVAIENNVAKNTKKYSPSKVAVIKQQKWQTLKYM